MGTQIKLLTKWQLINLFGINVLFHTSDKKARQKALSLSIVGLFVVIVMLIYVGGFSYGFIRLGLGDVLPVYLIAVTSLVIFFFTMFKTGSVIFQKNGYDNISALPLYQGAVVISRFIRMYFENLLFSFAIMLPGIAVYAYFLKPSISFYSIAVIEILFIPLVPLTAATLFGALITAITSRMRHKSLLGAGLSVALVVVIMVGSTSLGSYDEAALNTMIHSMTDFMTQAIGGIYPPAMWMGTAMLQGDFLLCLLCIAGSVLAFLAVIALVSVKFHAICRGLFGTYAKHNYQVGALKQNSALLSLCTREFKRYFASSVYVTNTIIGPVMGVLLSIGILVSGEEKIMEFIPLQTNVAGLIPFLLACVCSMMPPTCSSISLEGKEWWIVKSLPVSTQTILDSKVLMSLLLILPFYTVSEVLLMIALQPGFLETIWLLLIPAIIILFSCVFGMTINLKLPVFTWENEVSVVKQSASALIGGLGGFLLAGVLVVPIILYPEVPADLLKLLICVLLLTATVMMHRSYSRVNLQEL